MKKAETKTSERLENSGEMDIPRSGNTLDVSEEVQYSVVNDSSRSHDIWQGCLANV